MLAFAWLTIAVVSDAPLISWDVWKKREAPRWLGVGQSLAAATLLGVTQVFASLHPARGFLFAMTAFAVGESCVVATEHTQRWAQWARGVPQQRRLLIHAFVRLIPTFLIIPVVVILGLTRSQLFLVRGDLAAPSTLFSFAVSWAVLGPTLALVSTVVLGVELARRLRPEPRLRPLLGASPQAVVFAGLNAANEEFQFRLVPLALLVPLVGANQALWMTVALFGLAHWSGHPSGPRGIVLAGFAGLVWGQSMLDTGSAFWAWSIHGVQDLVIFGFLVGATRASPALAVD